MSAAVDCVDVSCCPKLCGCLSTTWPYCHLQAICVTIFVSFLIIFVTFGIQPCLLGFFVAENSSHLLTHGTKQLRHYMWASCKFCKFASLSSKSAWEVGPISEMANFCSPASD
jgi:hypothetical protein